MPSAALIKVRKRATTRALLGDRYTEVVTGITNPPKPVEPLDDSGETGSARDSSMMIQFYEANEGH